MRIDVATLREVLLYDPDTGLLIWRERSLRHFKSRGRWRSWNALYAGMPAFVTDDGKGYRQARIFNRNHRAHRVAWALHYGEWPADQVDHINGDRDDNRLANLRAVSPAENQKNTRRRRDNKSGSVGVHWSKQRQKWQAEICDAGVKRHLGFFDCLDCARSAREAASRKQGFHPNHGRADHR